MSALADTWYRTVWRAPNLVLVRSNAPEAVVDASRSAQLSVVAGRVFTPVMVERALWATRRVSRGAVHKDSTA